ncbi:MAG: hypothetical protein ACK559_21355 [bacterium]
MKGMSSPVSLRSPEMARLSSGPASWRVRRPAWRGRPPSSKPPPSRP